MKREISIRTLYGAPIPTPLVLERHGELVRITLDGAFAGRDVDEELPLAAFVELLGGGPRKNYDLLGFTLETEGGEDVVGLVGVGSGYEKFVVTKADLKAALDL